jgi:hypothetical protein
MISQRIYAFCDALNGASKMLDRSCDTGLHCDREGP